MVAHGCTSCGSLKTEDDGEGVRGDCVADPFAPVLIWKHTKYWCEKCVKDTEDRKTVPWREEGGSLFQRVPSRDHGVGEAAVTRD